MDQSLGGITGGDRVVRVDLPSVAAQNSTSVVDYQWLWASVELYARYSPGGPLYPYLIGGLFYTRAADNAYMPYWFPQGGNTAQQFVDIDTHTYGDGTGPEILAAVSIYWYTGSTATYQASYWATNPLNSNNAYVCNGGGDLFFIS